MKKSKITGWKDVYLFTFIQTIKNKAFLISLLFLLIIAAVSMPVITLITSKSSSKGIGSISKVYVVNNTSFAGLDFSDINKIEGLQELTIVNTDENYDVLTEIIEKNENTSIILGIADQDGMYQFSFLRSSVKTVKDSHMKYLSVYFLEAFEQQRLSALGISEQQREVIDMQVRIETYNTDNKGSEIIEEDTSISQAEYWFLYGLLLIIFLINTMASTQISTSIVSDKSSKVIEYLLTSVKPLAIIIGKILAMLSAVLFQAAAIIITIFVSNKVTALISDSGSSILSTYIPKGIFNNFSIINIVLCLFMAALGLLFYATIAGLFGACVSRIEEANEGMTLFTIIDLAGFYIGIIAAGIMVGSGDSAFVTFALLFPLSAPFLLPGAVLIGKADILLVLASILIVLLCVVLIFRFAAKVFETLILHNGNKIGIKELFKISKSV